MSECKPVEPVWKNQTPYCGNCGRHLKKVGLNIKDKFCGDCGRRVKWTECNPFNGEPIKQTGVEMLDDITKYQCSGCGTRFDFEIVYLIGGFDAWLFCPCCGGRIKQ